jgi:hypothetical protein
MTSFHPARAIAPLLLCMLVAIPAVAKLDRNVHIARTSDSTGAVLHSVTCVDIVVHLRDRQWVRADSALFYDQRMNVGAASAVLLPLVDSLKALVGDLTSHASTLVSSGRYTRDSLNRTVHDAQTQLEIAMNAQRIALKRLEDYHQVETAVRAIQRGRTP